VGGLGYLMFRFPDFLAKINAQFRPNLMKPGTKFIRWMGIIEMTLAGLTLIGSLLLPAFGIKL
jgi:hypothetical protein